MLTTRSRDGSRVYYLSDREEDYHVWAVNPSDGTDTPERLTEGAWAVSSIHPVEGGIVVVGNAPNPEERRLFFAGENGGAAQRLSQRAGTHDPVVSPDGRYAAVAFSVDDTPPELLITRLDGEGREWKITMDKVGIWGSSYGGLMTAMSLFKKPGLYAAGIAGAPATNVWHALTGQMAVMLAPEDSPDEYAESSAYLHGHGLQDPLLFIHGMRDRVVLFKDTITLLHRLILLGKDVDLVTLPDAGHGWDNESLVQTRFAFKKMVEFFDRHLKGMVH